VPPSAQQPTGTPASADQHGGPRAALIALAAALDPGAYTAELVTDDGPGCCLLVASRHAQLSETIHVNGQFYLWPWGQQIAALTSPQAAASKVAAVLAAAPETGGKPAPPVDKPAPPVDR
jgi:hypothetical protein